MALFDRLFGKKKDPQTAFAEKVIAGLKAAGDVRAMTFESKEFCLKIGDGTAWLGNYFARYNAAPPAGRAAALAFVVESIRTAADPIPDSFEACRPLLLPTIRPRAEIEAYRLQAEANGQRIAEMPAVALAGTLAATLGIDSATNIRIVGNDDLDRWQVSLEAALVDARENLRARSTDLFRRVGPDLYLSPWQDSYDAARLLLPELFDGFNVPGTLLAMAPCREKLFVTGSDSAEGLRALAAAAEEIPAGMRPVSTEILARSAAGWTPFILDPERPEHWPLVTLQAVELTRRYHQQKELLDAVHQHSGTDIFVASHKLMRAPDDSLFSYASWSDGVEALLPRVDRLVLTCADGRIVDAPWPAVVRLAADLLVPTGSHPERFHVRRFPTEDVLAVLSGEPDVRLSHMR